jgi:osmotically-inducible protein OsmY
MSPLMNGQRRFGQGVGMSEAQSAATTPSVRTTLSVAFDTPTRDPQKFSASLAERLAEAPALHWQTPSQVVIQGRTAILRGVAATEHDRDLAERMVRLEAGIEQVQNEIVVAGPGQPHWAKPKKLPAAAESPASAHSTPAGDSPKNSPPANSLPAQR